MAIARTSNGQAESMHLISWKQLEPEMINPLQEAQKKANDQLVMDYFRGGSVSLGSWEVWMTPPTHLPSKNASLWCDGLVVTRGIMRLINELSSALTVVLIRLTHLSQPPYFHLILPSEPGALACSRVDSVLTNLLFHVQVYKHADISLFLSKDDVHLVLKE